MPQLLTDLPRYVYGTTRLGGDDVPREQQQAMTNAALDAGLWLHTSRQYGHALELIGGVLAERSEPAPPFVVKIGGGTADDVRAEVAVNITPLGVDSVAIGQLSPVEGLDDALVAGGEALAGLQQLKDEGLVGRYVLEIFPWTSAAPLAGAACRPPRRAVDGFIVYLNPLQRFASNEPWDELVARDASIIAMRTVSGAPVHTLRDVPGAAWQPHLQQRATQVAPVFEASGIASWAEFCTRFAFSHPQVVATVGSASKQQNLDELVARTRGVEPLPADVVDELHTLQRTWSDEVDVHAEPWSI